MERLTTVVQDAPYGTEKAYNALRCAAALLNHHVVPSIFLLADGVAIAKQNQKVPTGYYNTADMLSRLIAQGVRVKT